MQDLEHMPKRSGFIQQAGIVPKRAEHLFCSGHVDTLEALCKATHMQGIAWATLLMLLGVKRVHAPILDLLQGGVMRSRWDEGTGSVQDESVQVFVVGQGFGKSLTHNSIVLRLVHASHSQNAQILWVDKHEAAIAIRLGCTIFSRSTFVLWRLTACALDMHLDMATPHNLIHLSSSMLGRRKDLIMEMLIRGTQRIRCQFLTNDDLFVQVQDIKFLQDKPVHEGVSMLNTEPI